MDREKRQQGENTAISIDMNRRMTAMNTISVAVEEKVICYKPSRFEIIKIQAQYISSAFWFSQVIFIAFLVIFLYIMDRQTEYMKEYIVYASMGAAFLGVIGVGELSRHTAYHMAEIEQTCYMNLKQLWTVRMIIMGMVDICVISIMIYLVAMKTRYSLTALCIYILVPFVISNIGYLILFTVNRIHSKYIQLAASLVLAMAATVPSIYPKAYTEGSLWIWALILAGAMAVLAGEIYFIMGKMAGGRTICLNYQ